MNLKKSLITSGSALTLIIASGCQSNNHVYSKTKNPYLLQESQSLPPVPMEPNTETAQSNNTVPEPYEAPETDGLSGLSNEGFVDAPEDVTPEENIVPPIEEPAPEAAKPRYYTVKKGDTLSEIAYSYGISYKTLAAENGLSVKKSLKIGQKLKLPLGASSSPKKASKKGKPTGKSTASAKGGEYKVKRGENLWTIPKKFGVKRSDFMSANGFSKNTVLQIGQTVVIPGKSTSQVKSSSSKKRSTSTINYNTEATASGDTYTVKNGDNPWTIAKKLKVRHSDLMSVNNLSSSSMLKIGQVLSVPGKAKKTSTAEETAFVSAEPSIETPSESLIITDTATTADPVANTDEPPATIAEVEHTTYAVDVAEGDTLEGLASIHNASVDDLKKYNPAIQSNDDLKPGTSILIPFKE